MKKICEDDHNLTILYNYHNPKRRKKIKAKPVSSEELSLFLKENEIKKLPTPEYTSTFNSRYKQSDIDGEQATRSRYSQAFRDKRKPEESK